MGRGGYRVYGGGFLSVEVRRGGEGDWECGCSGREEEEEIVGIKVQRKEKRMGMGRRGDGGGRK